MAEKYLKTGALNPAWCDEQYVAHQTERIMDGLEDFLNGDIDANLSLDLGDNVSLNISGKRTNNKSMCELVGIDEKDYEAKFNFIKQHSDNPEDLKLAREIIGLNT